MLRHIDALINRITMYRLTLWGITALAAIGIAWGFSGKLGYDGVGILLSLLALFLGAGITHSVLVRFFTSQTSVESSWITTYILFLIMPPGDSLRDYGLLALAAAIAVSSKYLLAIRHRHVFNPAAIAAVLMGLVFGVGAYWWVASPLMLPFTLIVALLVVRKIRRATMFLTTVGVMLATILVANLAAVGAYDAALAGEILREALVSWPVIFFAAVMVTEPATSPGTKRLQVIYGALVGLLAGSMLHIGNLSMTPELALVLGNIFAFIVSSKAQLTLRLVSKERVAKDVYHFTFAADNALPFKPGQYLEWTLSHPAPDVRGTRRYFTIASSPTEKTLGLGVKIQEVCSSFKRRLNALQPGDTLAAGHLAGDFTLPADPQEKLVFIAGGIGITPFRSMVRHLLDTNTKRDITLFYAGMTADDFAYRELFDEAHKAFGMKTVYVVTDKNATANGWKGYCGYLTSDIVRNEVPYATNCTFYLSGPNAMVTSYRTLLRDMGIGNRRIKTDYFPGL